MGRYSESNKYNATPRSVFDKYVDRMETKRLRDREDHRADMKALLQRIRNLENQLVLLDEHVQSHCHILNDEDEEGVPPEDQDPEGLE